MARFLITSDWHVGARMGSAGTAAPRFRDQKLETARRIVALAGAEEARALFLLGDTFEGDGVGLDDVERTTGILAEAPCPVFVLPGNHDWWHPGGVLQAFARLADQTENVRVLLDAEPHEVEGLPGLTFFPCPIHQRAGIADPTDWIPARDARHGLRVGLIHGALDRAEWGGRVPERVAEVRDLDLALMGDWHKPVEGPDGRTWYAGSPEPGGFDETHVGQVLLVNFEGGRPDVRRVPVGRLAWHRVEIELVSAEEGGAGVHALEDALAACGTPDENAALRVRVAGRLAPTELDALDALLETQAAAAWAHCEVLPEVEPLAAPDVDELFDDASLRAVAQRILDADADPLVCRRALGLLVRHAEAAS